ncbi:MAG TPA: PIN domain-containing protein [Pararhizobium sp.]|uniref:PIN domain-containing protein n=1 Tax=Pararhizobium sp. TaxID=1977563 RepID=UPI002B646CD6|nr:PIN domain-containing protein [Pararhizobium sp.]HTO33082.1 PIN domain-containing protein [Pararhizobium sp.]
MYLLDTNIVATLLLGKNPADQAIRIRDWLVQQSDSLYLCTVSVAEIEAGIAKARRQRASKKAEDLSLWLDTVLHAYADRILPLDVGSARLIGKLLDKAYGAGGMPDFEDAAIAAIAHSRHLQVLTRNSRHFEFFGVPFINPDKDLP